VKVVVLIRFENAALPFSVIEETFSMIESLPLFDLIVELDFE